MSKSIGRTRKDLSDRFWAKVTKGDGCWLWTGYKDRIGYGQLRRNAPPGKRSGSGILAHRAAWELTNGPTELMVLHRCDNPSCVNPGHLFLGTQADNLKDMREKGRGHTPRKLTASDVAAVRIALKNGESHKSIASRYGLVPSTIGHLARGRTYKNVSIETHN